MSVLKFSARVYFKRTTRVEAKYYGQFVPHPIVRNSCLVQKRSMFWNCMQKENTPRTLEEIYQRTHISKTTVYRILKTLVHRGYLAHSENGLYVWCPGQESPFGFGGESSEMPFSEE